MIRWMYLNIFLEWRKHQTLLTTLMLSWRNRIVKIFVKFRWATCSMEFLGVTKYFGKVNKMLMVGLVVINDEFSWWVSLLCNSDADQKLLRLMWFYDLLCTGDCNELLLPTWRARAWSETIVFVLQPHFQVTLATILSLFFPEPNWDVHASFMQTLL